MSEDEPFRASESDQAQRLADLALQVARLDAKLQRIGAALNTHESILLSQCEHGLMSIYDIERAFGKVRELVAGEDER